MLLSGANSESRLRRGALHAHPRLPRKRALLETTPVQQSALCFSRPGKESRFPSSSSKGSPGDGNVKFFCRPHRSAPERLSEGALQRPQYSTGKGVAYHAHGPHGVALSPKSSRRKSLPRAWEPNGTPPWARFSKWACSAAPGGCAEYGYKCAEHRCWGEHRRKAHFAIRSGSPHWAQPS